MTVAAPTAAEVRAARRYLQTRGVRSGDVSPARFASVHKELGKGYSQTLKYLVLLLSGGSGVGPSKIATADQDRLDPIRALGDDTPSQRLSYDNVRGPRD
jgi:hypothetical protein